jgi:hypothetical protein
MHVGGYRTISDGTPGVSASAASCTRRCCCVVQRLAMLDRTVVHATTGGAARMAKLGMCCVGD